MTVVTVAAGDAVVATALAYLAVVSITRAIATADSVTAVTRSVHCFGGETHVAHSRKGKPPYI